MTHGRAFASATVFCCAVAAAPIGATAQVAPPQPHHYLLVPDVADARGLWLNPAGMARRLEATAGAYATVQDSLSQFRLAQFGVLFATRGFAFGWQRDAFDGRSGNVFAAGLGLGDERFAMGLAKKWYRGAGSAGSTWDLGAHVQVSPMLSVAASWRDISSPTVRDSVLEESIAAGPALTFMDGRFRVSAEWRAATSGFVTRATRVGVSTAVARGMGFSAIADFSPDVRQRGFAIAVHLSRPTLRVALFRREAQLRNAADRQGLSVTSVTPAPTRRRFPR